MSDIPEFTRRFQPGWEGTPEESGAEISAQVAAPSGSGRATEGSGPEELWPGGWGRQIIFHAVDQALLSAMC